MKPKAKVYLFMGFFFVLLLSYLLPISVFPKSLYAQMTEVFENISLNFVLLITFFIIFSLVLALFTDLIYTLLLKIKWFRPKIGTILVSRNYVTESELKEALLEQKQKLGEILLKEDRITIPQLKEALLHQKKSKKLGEILKEMGHSTEEDIDWALSKKERKLGEILIEKDLLTVHELNWVLSIQRYGIKIIRKLVGGKFFTF